MNAIINGKNATVSATAGIVWDYYQRRSCHNETHEEALKYIKIWLLTVHGLPKEDAFDLLTDMLDNNDLTVEEELAILKSRKECGSIIDKYRRDELKYRNSKHKSRTGKNNMIYRWFVEED